MNALADLKAAGIDVPTYTDLVELGVAPDLREKKEKAPKRTSAQVQKDRVTKLGAARKATGAQPLKVAPPKSEQKKSLF
jgi:hypothetical protein